MSYFCIRLLVLRGSDIVNKNQEKFAKATPKQFLFHQAINSL